VKVLFDQGMPQPLRRELDRHTIDTVYEQGWSTLKNGDLLAAAEQAGYDLFVTTDQNLHYQQNLTGRRMAILVLRTTSWPKIRPHVKRIQDAIDATDAGAYYELSFDAQS
jgi:predicted nuclease of predicted toxin-antitoxin system